jgi:hypothetical protein
VSEWQVKDRALLLLLLLLLFPTRPRKRHAQGLEFQLKCCPLEDSLRANCHKLQDLPEATWNNNKTMPHARLEDVEARAANHVRLCA